MFETAVALPYRPYPVGSRDAPEEAQSREFKLNR
jgi:hypothetical protein